MTNKLEVNLPPYSHLIIMLVSSDSENLICLLVHYFSLILDSNLPGVGDFFFFGLIHQCIPNI